MNIEMVNNRISQLPIAMAGIVHAFLNNGRGLSNFNDTSCYTIARSHLPACTD
ncbi:RAxF-45 family protein [Paenibacillus lautus]|uniref:RAxF-45 family protein n=1 Tax=Paenibacillus lautus TaxID=1401 RepID=UPI003D9A4436